jgi:hypothetical protein
MNHRGLSAQFGVFNREEGRPFLGSAKEVEMEGDGVRLALRGERGVEMGEGYFEENGCNKAAVRH